MPPLLYAKYRNAKHRGQPAEGVLHGDDDLRQVVARENGVRHAQQVGVHDQREAEHDAAQREQQQRILTQLEQSESVTKSLKDAGIPPKEAVNVIFKLKGKKDKSKPIVISTRISNGYTSTRSTSPAQFVAAGTLNPQKARILLQLALTKTDNIDEIKRIFEAY